MVEKHRDQKELIELGELESTSITESEYKELLKMVNNWRIKLDE